MCTPSATSADALAALGAQLDALLADDGLCLSAEAKLDRVIALGQLEAKVQALSVRWIGEVAATDASVEVEGRTTKSWLIEDDLHWSPKEAGRRVRVGGALALYPHTREALEAGTITLDHVEVIIAAMKHVPTELRDVVEQALVASAREVPAYQVARDADELLAALGVEKSSQDAHERRFAQRGVGIDETLGGTGSLNGTLTAEVREKVATALAAAAAKAGPEDERTHRQRWHDALGEIADFYLAHADLPAVNGERPRVVVTMDLETLQGKLEQAWARLDSGVKIGPETARRHACDAQIIPVVLGTKGEVLDLGQPGGEFSAAVRRAAWIRDGGRCTFPGCTRPPKELHHIIWRHHGGKPTLINATWLCVFHHWLVHEGGWTLRRDPGGGLTFTSPTGAQRRNPGGTSPPRQPQAA